jgi:hypothetical protein
MGPFATETLLGEKYALTYTDWYSRYSWTYLLRLKSDALPKLKHLLEVVFPAAGFVLKHYHTDNAGELSGKDTVEYLERTIHATHSTSEPYTPQRNAVAERKFRTIGEITATMLHDSGLPKTMWGYAFLAATYIRNRIPSVLINGTVKSPYELWTGKVPCIRHLRRWGCKCFPYVPKSKRVKDWADKALLGYLVGYTEENAYVVYVPSKGTTVTTVMLTFDEAIPTHAEFYWKELSDPPVVDTITGDVADFQCLVDIQYLDPDDGFKYQTTRVVVERGLIVAYRTPVKADGTPTSMEEDSPIHVKNVVRMIAATQLPLSNSTLLR